LENPPVFEGSLNCQDDDEGCSSILVETTDNFSLPISTESLKEQTGEELDTGNQDESTGRQRRRRKKIFTANDGEDDDEDSLVDLRGIKSRRRRRGPQEVFQFVHYAEEPGGKFFCRYPGCQYADSFRSLTNCKNHQLAQHATDAEKVFACDACAERFASQRLRNKHANQAHNMRFSCEVCGRKFADRTRLRIHSRVHTGEKPFVCEHCGYSCSQRDNLKKHKGEKDISGVLKKIF
jgi:Zinc finger, C2H2 type